MRLAPGNIFNQEKRIIEPFIDVRCRGSHADLRPMQGVFALSRLYPKNREMPGLREAHPAAKHPMPLMPREENPAAHSDHEDHLAGSGPPGGDDLRFGLSGNREAFGRF